MHKLSKTYQEEKKTKDSCHEQRIEYQIMLKKKINLKNNGKTSKWSSGDDRTMVIGTQKPTYTKHTLTISGT